MTRDRAYVAVEYSLIACGARRTQRIREEKTYFVGDSVSGWISVSVRVTLFQLQLFILMNYIHVKHCCYCWELGLDYIVAHGAIIAKRWTWAAVAWFYDSTFPFSIFSLSLHWKFGFLFSILPIRIDYTNVTRVIHERGSPIFSNYGKGFEKGNILMTVAIHRIIIKTTKLIKNNLIVLPLCIPSAANCIDVYTNC